MPKLDDSTNDEEVTQSPRVHLFDFFLPEAIRAGGPDLRRRANLLTGWALTLGLIGAITLPILWTYQEGPTATCVGVVTASLITLSVPLIMRLTGSFHLAAMVLLCNMLVSTIFHALITTNGGTTLAPWEVLSWNVLVPLLAGFLLSPGHAIAFAGVIVLEHLALFAVHLGFVENGITNFTRQQALMSFFSASSLTTFVGLLAWVYERARLEAVDRADTTLDVLTSTNRELEVAHREAERASRAKSDFLARMNHELRTPINGVLGMNELLLDSPLNPEQRNSSMAVRESAKALLALVNDTLDLSQVEAGRLRVHPACFDPRQAVEESAHLLARSAAAKGLDLHWEIGPDVPEHFVSDPNRVRQILLNLLGNAVKYTNQGHITVKVQGTQGTQGTQDTQGTDPGLRFEVQDTGIGMNKEARTRLFEPFYQADASWTRRHGGMGLGLAIARELCELLEGEIGLLDGASEGSTFWFQIPQLGDDRLVFAPHQDPARGTATQGTPTRFPDSGGGFHPGPPATNRSRLLVVEDNDVNRTLAVQMLERLGYEVEIAINGRRAVEACRGGQFDLILMDCQMPEMDGFEAAAEIRKLAREGGPLRIIAATASTMTEDRKRCLEAGMDDYIAKPYLPRQLAEIVAQWV